MAFEDHGITLGVPDEERVAVNDAAALRGDPPVRHFIQDLGFVLEPIGARGLALRATTTHGGDVGLLATIVDVVGGLLILQERPRATAIPTTNIELHGVERLGEPGAITAVAGLISSSKRRATVEVSLDLAGAHAWAVIGFAVREDRAQSLLHTDSPRPQLGRLITEPLWTRIGVSQGAGQAVVDVDPWLHNNAEALQGGATMALLEAAALSVLEPHERFGVATINYFRQVVGSVAEARVRARSDRFIVVDVRTDRSDQVCASAVFNLQRSPA